MPKELRGKVNHIKISPSFWLKNLLRLYCIAPKIFFFLKVLIQRDPYVNYFKDIQNPIIFHQNFQLGLFLSLTHNKLCIYDIHGFYLLQKENIENVGIKEKFFYYSNLLIEINYFRYGKYFTVASKETKIFLIKSFKIKPENIFVAEEGLLDYLRKDVDHELIQKIRLQYDISKNDFIIFFAGNFKKFGGVFDLVKAFYDIHKKLSNVKLLLLGSGQEELRIKNFIKRNSLEANIIFINATKVKMHLGELPSYQYMANIVVCPDRNNYYNQITPHIKIYDSIASGKPVILADFDCLHEIISEFRGLEMFKPGNIEDLIRKIELIFQNYSKYSIDALENIERIKGFSYQEKIKFFIKQIVERFY